MKIPPKFIAAIRVVTGGTLGFVIYSTAAGNERFYKEVIMPTFRVFDAETSHRLGIKLAQYRLLPILRSENSPTLSVNLFGRTFTNPVGCAAGFDKHAEAMQGILQLGFGFVEIGTVTPEPQPGNDKPRVFRLTADSAIINRYGFNSDGATAVLQRLEAWRQSNNVGILGVNLGVNSSHSKNSVDAAKDYRVGVEKFGHITDYLVINVSSPNTEKLRELQKRTELEYLLDEVLEARNALKCSKKPPVLLKISPDLKDEEVTDVVRAATRKNKRIDGFIISNTTLARPDSLMSPEKSEKGGLSGPVLTQVSTRLIGKVFEATKGEIPIIGVGGISSGADALDKIKAGASLVQLYTAFSYEGPPVVNRIKRELSELLEKEGFRSLEEAVGANYKVNKTK